MTKISGEVLSVKHVPLSRAAKLVTRFSSVENGASTAVSTYMQRTAEAFNRLAQFHGSRAFESSDVVRYTNADEGKYLNFRVTKAEKSADLAADEEDKKKSKKKKKSVEGADLNEKMSSRKKKAKTASSSS